MSTEPYSFVRVFNGSRIVEQYFSVMIPLLTAYNFFRRPLEPPLWSHPPWRAESAGEDEIQNGSSIVRVHPASEYDEWALKIWTTFKSRKNV